MQSIIMKMKAKNVLPALAGAMLVLQASAQHWGFSLQAGYLNNHITAQKLTSGPFEGFTAGATLSVPPDVRNRPPLPMDARHT